LNFFCIGFPILGSRFFELSEFLTELLVQGFFIDSLTL